MEGVNNEEEENDELNSMILHYQRLGEALTRLCNKEQIIQEKRESEEDQPGNILLSRAAIKYAEFGLLLYQFHSIDHQPDRSGAEHSPAFIEEINLHFEEETADEAEDKEVDEVADDLLSLTAH